MKKTKIVLTALIAMSILAFTALIGCSKPDPEYTVKYEITGPASVISYVSYYNETGALDSLQSVNIPWTKTIIVSGKNHGVGCSFMNYSSSSTNTYTCIVYVNGKEVKRASGNSNATATYVIQ